MSGERAMYAHPVFESHAALRLRKLHATSGSRDGRLSRHAISSRAYYARTNWLINGGALRSALAGAGAAAASEVLSGGGGATGGFVACLVTVVRGVDCGVLHGGTMKGNRGNAVVLGASREGGTGWAISEAMTASSLHVTVAARSRAGIEKLATKIGGTAIVCDATVEHDIATMLDAVVAERGPIDAAVLVAGAGITGTIDGISATDLQHALALNFFAPVYFVRHVARRMRDGGSIVLMTSIAATNAWPGYFAYGSAKAAVHTLVKYAALEYAPRAIRVNAVCPGPIETAEASVRLGKNPHLVAALAREVPLQRRASTGEVAEAIVWFATHAHCVTGEWLHVDGGLHLRRPPFPDEFEAAMQKGDRQAAKPSSGETNRK
jgi:NAD(P)-dependent dehydrogenase (short-subunit alcohol dehydrogenase family)